MKTRTVREALLLCAAVLAVACAVLLPPFLSQLADRRLAQAQYAVQAETLDVSLVYQMSTVQRLTLLAQFDRIGEQVLYFDNGQPAQDELSAEQAAALAQEELDRLYQLGVLPDRFTLPDTPISARYIMLCDRDNRQRSVSLWVLTLSESTAYYPSGNSCTLAVDAQTGLIYSLSLVLDGTPEFSLEDAAAAWGTYLDLGVPTIQEKYEVPSDAGGTDTVEWVSTGFQALSAAYETDDGTIPCYFRLEQNPHPKLPTSTVIITPFSPSSGQ